MTHTELHQTKWPEFWPKEWVGSALENEIEIRNITSAEDAAMARIVRTNLEAYGLDIPGTAFFDPELDHLSAFYNAEPKKRAYYVAIDADGTVLGGAGFAEFEGLPQTAELQKSISPMPRKARD